MMNDLRSTGRKKGIMDGYGGFGRRSSDDMVGLLIPQDGAERRLAIAGGLVGFSELHRPDFHSSSSNCLSIDRKHCSFSSSFAGEARMEVEAFLVDEFFICISFFWAGNLMNIFQISRQLGFDTVR